MKIDPSPARAAGHDGAGPVSALESRIARSPARQCAVALIVTLAALALGAASAWAAIINRAHIDQMGPVVELHFDLTGRGLQWHLSAHGNQLWLDLNDTRIALPPRPFYGRETPPVAAVFAIDSAGTRARIVIDVTGRTDYSVATLPHELVVRLTRAEAGGIPPAM
ncbi:MAG TPA: hypothetical protein VNF45_02810, partial [Candidatus Binataceae bacterium]|nr:hypothetical protein [Candidatus Binataceae bacterium]